MIVVGTRRCVRYRRLLHPLAISFNEFLASPPTPGKIIRGGRPLSAGRPSSNPRLNGGEGVMAY